MKKSTVKKLVSGLTVLSLAASSLPFNVFAAGDLTGHWAEEYMSKLAGQNVLTGDPGGNFRPDDNITRAEYITMLNNVFGFVDKDSKTFSDVQATDWFLAQMQKAVAAGYLAGNEDGTATPNAPLTRQDAFTFLWRAAKLSEGSVDQLSFKDNSTISTYAKTAIAKLVQDKVISGYPDGTINPMGNIKRSEASTIVSRFADDIYSTPGTFKGAEGKTFDSVVVNKADVHLQDMTINGDLYIAPGVDEGDASLSNVTVKGTVFVQGGGVNTVKFTDCKLNDVAVKKQNDKPVRLLIEGASSVDQIDISSLATVDVKAGTIDAINVIKDVLATVKTEKGAVISSIKSMAALTLNGTKVAAGKVVAVAGTGTVSIDGAATTGTTATSGGTTTTNSGGSGGGDSNGITNVKNVYITSKVGFTYDKDGEGKDNPSAITLSATPEVFTEFRLDTTLNPSDANSSVGFRISHPALIEQVGAVVKDKSSSYATFRVLAPITTGDAKLVTITAYALQNDAKTAVCTIPKVGEEPQKVTGVTVTPGTYELEVNKVSDTFTATVQGLTDNDGVTWSIPDSDKDKISIASSTKYTATVQAIATGSALQLIATSVDNPAKSGIATIDVKDVVTPNPLDTINIEGPTTLDIKDKTAQFKYTLNPEGANGYGTIEWFVEAAAGGSASAIATIDSASGLLTIVGKGTVLVNAKSTVGNVTAIPITVVITDNGTVTPGELEKIEITGPDAITVKTATAQYTAVLTPADATNGTIAWSVEATPAGIATINSATGLLTVLGNGSVKVTAVNTVAPIVAQATKTVVITGQEVVATAAEIEAAKITAALFGDVVVNVTDLKALAENELKSGFTVSIVTDAANSIDANNKPKAVGQFEATFTVTDAATSETATAGPFAITVKAASTLTAITSVPATTVAAPVTDATVPALTITGTGYAGTVVWAPVLAAGDKFAAATAYTATVELNADATHKFDANATINVPTGATLSNKTLANADKKLTYTITFAKTGPGAVEGVQITAVKIVNANLIEVTLSGERDTAKNFTVVQSPSTVGIETGTPIVNTPTPIGTTNTYALALNTAATGGNYFYVEYDGKGFTTEKILTVPLSNTIALDEGSAEGVTVSAAQVLTFAKAGNYVVKIVSGADTGKYVYRDTAAAGAVASTLFTTPQINKIAATNTITGLPNGTKYLVTVAPDVTVKLSESSVPNLVAGDTKITGLDVTKTYVVQIVDGSGEAAGTADPENGAYINAVGATAANNVPAVEITGQKEIVGLVNGVTYLVGVPNTQAAVTSLVTTATAVTGKEQAGDIKIDLTGTINEEWMSKVTGIILTQGTVTHTFPIADVSVEPEYLYITKAKLKAAGKPFAGAVTAKIVATGYTDVVASNSSASAPVIDTKAPVLTALTVTRTNDTIASFKITSDEAITAGTGRGLFYSIDGSAPVTTGMGAAAAAGAPSAAISISGIAKGAFTLKVVAVDASGNVSQVASTEVATFSTPIPAPVGGASAVYKVVKVKPAAINEIQAVEGKVLVYKNELNSTEYTSEATNYKTISALVEALGDGDTFKMSATPIPKITEINKVSATDSTVDLNTADFDPVLAINSNTGTATTPPTLINKVATLNLTGKVTTSVTITEGNVNTTGMIQTANVPVLKSGTGTPVFTIAENQIVNVATGKTAFINRVGFTPTGIATDFKAVSTGFETVNGTAATIYAIDASGISADTTFKFVNTAKAAQAGTITMTGSNTNKFTISSAATSGNIAPVTLSGGGIIDLSGMVGVGVVTVSAADATVKADLTRPITISESSKPITVKVLGGGKVTPTNLAGGELIIDGVIAELAAGTAVNTKINATAKAEVKGSTEIVAGYTAEADLSLAKLYTTGGAIKVNPVGTTGKIMLPKATTVVTLDATSAKLIALDDEVANAATSFTDTKTGLKLAIAANKCTITAGTTGSGSGPVTVTFLTSAGVFVQQMTIVKDSATTIGSISFEPDSTSN